MLFLAKATAAAKKTGPKFVMSVCDALTKFLSDLSTSSVVESVPVAIRLGFLQLRKSIEKHRPALASIMPSAFFLHILCPCIMLPASDIAELFSPENLQPVLTMSTKLLQGAATCCLATDDYIKTYSSRLYGSVSAYIDDSLTPADETSSVGSKVVAKILKFLRTSAASIARFMDRLVNVDSIKRAQDVQSPRVIFETERKEALHELASFCESNKLATLLYAPLVPVEDEEALQKSKGGEEVSRSSAHLVDDEDDLEQSNESARSLNRDSRKLRKKPSRTHGLKRQDSMESDNSVASAGPSLMATGPNFRSRSASQRDTSFYDSDNDGPALARVSGKAFRNLTLGLEAAADVVSDSYYDTDDGAVTPSGSGSKTPVSGDSSPKRIRVKEIQQRKPAATVSDVVTFTKNMKIARGGDDRFSSRSLSASSNVNRSASFYDLENEIDDLLTKGDN
eukprot:TRINITY_DN674_c0_g1_i2.p1 TRINITY_DN674_c0_g1~~TRINITY_DN674_c0_g1_i2.p1  ORF type:complete len:452 (+),score=77.07 TRINITY_DN674_c0_g1_i2:607-1962(+)